MILNKSDRLWLSTLIGLAESNAQNVEFWDQSKNTEEY